MCICMWVGVYVYMYVGGCAYVYMYVGGCLYVYMYVGGCICVYMHAYMYGVPQSKLHVAVHKDLGELLFIGAIKHKIQCKQVNCLVD